MNLLEIKRLRSRVHGDLMMIKHDQAVIDCIDEWQNIKHMSETIESMDKFLDSLIVDIKKMVEEIERVKY